MRQKILIIEDDRDIAELESLYLIKADFDVKVCNDGRYAIDETKKIKPELILLDLILPFVDGLSICKELKLSINLRKIPIIIVSAKGEEADVIKGLNLGADDYIKKPFSPLELVARVKSVLRRASFVSSQSKEVSQYSMTLNTESRNLRVDGKIIDLSASEFDTLLMFLKNPERVFTRNQIIDNIHGEDYIVTERSIDVLVSGLRKKLGKSSKLIRTIWGVGYRFGENNE